MHSFIHANKYLVGAFYVPFLLEDSYYKHFIRESPEAGDEGIRLVPPAEGVLSHSPQPPGPRGFQAPTLAPQRGPARRIT